MAPAVTLTPTDVLRAEISKGLTSSNREGVLRVGEVSITDAVVTVRWAINDNLTANLIKAGMRRDVHTILAAVKGSRVDYSIVRIVGTFSMKDVYGNISESEVVNLAYRSTTIDKVNFAGIENESLIALADVEKLIHPEFR